ncbi:DUF3930 family protein [Microbacteriaceae bacterium 4G12]
MELKERLQDEENRGERSLLSFFASKSFDIMTDYIIKGLIIFLTVVGIPYTAYVLIQFFLL